jgi:hypothetical protein
MRPNQELGPAARSGLNLPEGFGTRVALALIGTVLERQIV